MDILTQAKELMGCEFGKCNSIVKNNPVYAEFAREKWLHSWQVMGAGNLIVKNEPWFKKQSLEVAALAKTAILLHDVGRFEEIVALFQNQKGLDHSRLGYEKLRCLPPFDKAEIYLPIKHHGHLMEEFYNDEEYLSLADGAMKERLQQFIFTIRDADKIANFYLIARDRHIFEKLFVNPEFATSPERTITQPVLKYFEKCCLIPNYKRQTCADLMLSYIAWMFDLNYWTSYKFCQKFGLIEKMFAYMTEYHDDRATDQRLRLLLENYLQQKFS